MKKLVALFLSVFIILGTFSLSVDAWDGKTHDDYLEKVLFGNSKSALQNGDKDSKKEKIKLIEAASYLTLDQFNGNGTPEMEELKAARVKNLPKLAEIDFNDNSQHRSHTHRGWNYNSYTLEKNKIPADRRKKDKRKDTANWSERKKILQSTTNKVFSFGFKNEFGGNYCDQCDSFSAFVYYVHILGDNIAEKDYKKTDIIIPFARCHASDDSPDIAWEMEKYMDILFADQKSTYTYMSMKSELNLIAGKARTLEGKTGGINTKDRFDEYQKYENEYMDVLIRDVPTLLENEEFFSKEFYDNN